MLSESIVTAITTASVTGAGLVIAFYALLARMSNKIFATRFEQLAERRAEVKQISSDQVSFDENNLKKTNIKLNELERRIHSMNAFPQYLGGGVIISFSLFIVTAVLSIFHLMGLSSELSGNVIMSLFTTSLFIFMGVGIYGIVDVNETMSGNFEKMKAQKEEIKREITNVPEENRVAFKIELLLRNIQVKFDRLVPVKANGLLFMPYFVIPSADNPKYMIDILINPTHGLIDNFAYGIRRLGETDIKMILISNFGDRELKILAESHWDYVIDIDSIEKLKTILTE